MPDAAQDEILPGRLEGRRGAVDADHQDRGQRRQFDGDPHQPDVVRQQRQVHREHQHLIHGVVEAQIGRRQASRLELVRDVAGAEDAGGEADERRQHDEHDVDVIDDEERSRVRGATKKRPVEARNVSSVPRTLSRAVTRSSGSNASSAALHGRHQQDCREPAAGPNSFMAARRGSVPARARPPCRSARGCGTGRCRSRSARRGWKTRR